MISIPVDFPLVITTHPLFIVLAYVCQIFSLLIASLMIWSQSLSAKAIFKEREKQLIEKQGKVPLPQDREQEMMWRARLRAFHVIPHDDEEAILEEVTAIWKLLNGPSALVLSLTTAVVPLVNLCFFIFTRGAVFHSLPVLLVLGTLFPLSVLLQSTVTYEIGFRHVKRTIRHHVAYADLSERHVSDYRSSVFRWLLGLVVVANCVLLLLLPSLPGLSHLSVSAPVAWVRIVISLGMLVTFAVGEFRLTRIVMLPRLIVTSDPVIAQRADDLLRAVIMNSMHGGNVNTLRNYLFLQWFFFLPWLLSSPLLLGTQLVATALVLLCWVPQKWPRSQDEKYLGGRKTGWPWRKEEVS
jgi:hypothetical protein